MPKFVIERDMPGVGRMSQQELQAGAMKSCEVLKQQGGEVHWQQSYVTPDKIFCVYVAPNEELIRKHAELSGFPATRISRVDSVIDPATAEPAKMSRAA